MGNQIDFEESVYIRDFYDKIIPQIRGYFHAPRGERLVFNFAGLKFLSPNVVPNLLNTADIYKKYYDGETILLKFSWNTELLTYLSTTNFFKYVDKYKLFSYDEEILGDYETFKPYENCKLIVSEKNSTEGEINREVDHLMESMGAFRKRNKENKKNDTVKEMLTNISRNLITNANDEGRGNSNAYGLFQINNYKENDVAYLSICDAGVGIANTIWRKFANKEVALLFVKHEDDPTYYFILEALFWRRRINYPPYKHGIFHAAEYILGKGGKMSIHSDDTYVLFTEEFLDYFNVITDIIDEQKKAGVNLEYSDDDILQDPLSKELRKLLDYYARRYARTRKYQGVHIDIEIPLGEIE